MPKKKTDVGSEKKIDVWDLKGEISETTVLPKNFLGVVVNQKLLAQYIRVYLANQRQGTSSTKTRGEVAGSTRKIYRQKGTGRARHGSIKAPIFVGGGIVFGPKPRDYSLKFNKKQRKLAFKMALGQKFSETRVKIVKNLEKIPPKTKVFRKFLETLGFLETKQILVVYDDQARDLILAARNLARVTLASMQNLNVYDILKSKEIILSLAALKFLAKEDL